MIRVGLTGNIASGKSTVANEWRVLGARLIDADVLAREAVAPGSAGLRAVADTFGDDIVRDGVLDRAALRAIVFNDPARRARLEAIIHPEVMRLRSGLERDLEAQGAHVVVNDIPLLFETGMQDQFDVLVLVDAPAGERVRRLVRDRGLTPAQAQQMVDAQMPSTEKRSRANFVIDNDGSVEELLEKARSVWREITERVS